MRGPLEGALTHTSYRTVWWCGLAASWRTFACWRGAAWWRWRRTARRSTRAPAEDLCTASGPVVSI